MFWNLDVFKGFDGHKFDIDVGKALLFIRRREFGNEVFEFVFLGEFIDSLEAIAIID